MLLLPFLGLGKQMGFWSQGNANLTNQSKAKISVDWWTSLAL
jgi:hypothetical protein